MIQQIRWMVQRDLIDVLAIEAATFEAPWTEENFRAFLRERNCIGMVVELLPQPDYDSTPIIAGYMLYELRKQSIRIASLAVHEPHRRQGVGRLMIDKLKSKLAGHRRTRIILDVRETNLAAQQFLRSQGFRATKVLRRHYEDSGEDCYRMEFAVPAEASVEVESSGE